MKNKFKILKNISTFIFTVAFVLAFSICVNAEATVTLEQITSSGGGATSLIFDGNYEAVFETKVIGYDKSLINYKSSETVFSDPDFTTNTIFDSDRGVIKSIVTAKIKTEKKLTFTIKFSYTSNDSTAGQNSIKYASVEKEFLTIFPNTSTATQGGIYAPELTLATREPIATLLGDRYRINVVFYVNGVNFNDSIITDVISDAVSYDDDYEVGQPSGVYKDSVLECNVTFMSRPGKDLHSFSARFDLNFKENGSNKGVTLKETLNPQLAPPSMTPTNTTQLEILSQDEVYNDMNVKITCLLDTDEKLLVGKHSYTNIPFTVETDYVTREITYEFVQTYRSGSGFNKFVSPNYDIRIADDDEGSPVRNFNVQVKCKDDKFYELVFYVCVHYIDNNGNKKQKQEYLCIQVEKDVNDTGSNISGVVDADVSGIYGDPNDLLDILAFHGGGDSGLGDIIYGFAKGIAGILTFVCIIMVGVNIILARGKADERMSSMQGLMYIVIGVVIFDCVFLIYSLLRSIIGSPEADLPNLYNESIVEEYNEIDL